jgi:EthD domain-containing protein
MEKLIYVLLGARRLDAAELARELTEAGARKIALNLADAHVAGKQASRIARVEPEVGAVASFWLDDVDERAPLEGALARRAERLAGYSVLESVALANATHRPQPGERTPGVNVIACIAAAPGMPRGQFLEHWLERHRAVALELQATYAYVRNVVVRPLTANAPAWDGIVEEGFPTEAVGDPMLWYKAGGSQDVLNQRLGRMIASCREFLDLARVEQHPLSEYVFDDGL